MTHCQSNFWTICSAQFIQLFFLCDAIHQVNVNVNVNVYVLIDIHSFTFGDSLLIDLKHFECKQKNLLKNPFECQKQITIHFDQYNHLNNSLFNCKLPKKKIGYLGICIGSHQRITNEIQTFVYLCLFICHLIEKTILRISIHQLDLTYRILWRLIKFIFYFFLSFWCTEATPFYSNFKNFNVLWKLNTKIGVENWTSVEMLVRMCEKITPFLEMKMDSLSSLSLNFVTRRLHFNRENWFSEILKAELTPLAREISNIQIKNK